jgi:hypothetical protein
MTALLKAAVILLLPLCSAAAAIQITDEAVSNAHSAAAIFADVMLKT